MNLTRLALALGSAADSISSVQQMGVDDLLGLVGLARRHSAFGRVMPVVGLIGFGAVLGAGTALLLTPSSGKEMRAKLSDKFDAAKSKVEGKLLAAEASASNAAHAARDALSNPRLG